MSTSFPMPPGFKKPSQQLAVTATGTTPKPDPLGPEAVSYILQTTLLPEHHENPHVLRFISSYLNCRDIKQASQEAGIHPNQGKSLRGRQDVHLAITKLTEVAVLKHGIDPSTLVERIKEVTDADPADLERADGTFVTSLREIPPETRRAIKKFKAKNLYETDPNGMKVLVGKLVEVEFYDRMKGAELLGREVGLFKETSVVEHDVTANMGAILLGAAERAERAALAAREEKMRDVVETVAVPVLEGVKDATE